MKSGIGIQASWSFPDFARSVRLRKKYEREKQEAERWQSLFRNHRILRCGTRPAGARSPVGVPPRLLSKGLAHPKDCSDQASRSAAPKRHQAAGYPRQRRPRLQRAPRVPVIMPADMMSEPPGSKGDEPLPAGTALAPPDGVTARRPCKRASRAFLGSGLIKSTIQARQRGRQRPGNCVPACRSGLRCA